GKRRRAAGGVAGRPTPRWPPTPDHGPSTNRRGLSPAERLLVRQWVQGGKLPGDAAKAPKPLPPAESRWQIGAPDLVIRAVETHELPAEGVVAYKYVLLPHLFPNDTWVQGVQILPDNPRVVHHCNMAWVRLGDGFKVENFVTGFAPGGEAMTLEAGAGCCTPKGAALILQIHYVTTGKQEKCNLAVGLKYARGVVQKRLRFHLLVDTRFAIPPGAPAHRVTAGRTLAHDAE